MFNTMNLTKAAGAVLGATLFLLLGNWAATSLYSIGSAGHGEAVASAEAPAGETAPAPASDAAPAGDAVAVAEGPVVGDADAGAKVFGKCKACHKVDGKNATGPHLDGVVGRAVGSIEDFSYSDAMKGHGGDWTAEMLDAYLTKPKDYIPGNKMSFAGLPKAQDRANVIAYLESLAN